MHRDRWGNFGSAFALLTLWGVSAGAQELTPRAYWPAPKGTKALVVSLGRSSGDIVFDPSLPLVGVDSDIRFGQLGYQQFFSLAGRTASALVSLPYARGDTAGTVDGEFRSRHTSGWGDMRARLAINLLGAPSMDVAGFQELRAEPRTLLGASLEISAPTGDYDPDRLINIGTNRWAVKTALGMIYPMRRKWLAEFELGSWFFEDNDDFLGFTREQDPIVFGSFHLIKRIRPGFWASLDTTMYGGGRTTFGGELNTDLQRSARAGATLVFPFKRRHAIRASYSTGVTTELGGDFRTTSLTYQVLWN